MVKDFDQPPLKALIQNNFSVIAIDIRGDKEVAINAEYTLSDAVPPVTTPVFACTIPTNNINKIIIFKVFIIFFLHFPLS
jgi:hypothetical protein